MKKQSGQSILICIVVVCVLLNIGWFIAFAKRPVEAEVSVQNVASESKPTAQEAEQEAEILVFVSLKESLQSLKDWGVQAAALEAPLLFRQSPRSLSTMSQEKIAAVLKEEPTLRIESDAAFFEKFDIQECDLQRNPILVLVVHRPRLLSFLAPRFIKIEGASSPAGALIRMMDRKGEDLVLRDAAYRLFYLAFRQ